MASTQTTRFASGAVLMASVALFGCAAGAGSTPLPATAVSGATIDEEALADLNEHHRHHHQGGVTMFIALSLDSLGLSPEQQAAITKIQSGLFAKLEPARAAERSLLLTLADGIAAGAIDQAKLDAAITELRAASAEVHGATADTLNQLHAALTPPQRAALADKVLAHWNIYRQGPPSKERVGSLGHDEGHFTRLTKDLGLSPEQVIALDVRLGSSLSVTSGTDDPWRVDAHLRRLAEFRADTFDARKLSGGAEANADAAGHGAVRMVHLYQAALPLLTPEQRTKAVQLLREHAGHKDEAVDAPK